MKTSKATLFYVALLIFFILYGCEKDKETNTGLSKDNINVLTDEESGEHYVINPFDYAPMTAGIEFMPETDLQWTVTATVTVEGQKNSPDFVKEYSFEADTNETYWIPIVGMYAGTENIVKVLIKNQSNNDILHDAKYTITLPEIPEEDVGSAALAATITGNFAGDEMILVLPNVSSTLGVNTFRPIVYDKQGNIRYYNTIPNAYMQIVLNNQLYVGFKGEKINHLSVYNFLGQELYDWELSGWENIHHDIIENTLGNLVITINKDDDSPVEQHLVEFNPSSNQTNQIVNAIDLSNTFPNVDELFMDLPQGDFANGLEDIVHNNFVSYYERDGQTIYLCSSQRSGIAAVDQSGFPQWYFFPKGVQYSVFNDTTSAERLPASGSFPHLDYSANPTYANLLVDPVDQNENLITDKEITYEGKVKSNVDFIFPFRQHGVNVIDYDDNSVTFTVLDNSMFRGFESNSTNATSRAVCFKVTFDQDGRDESTSSSADVNEYFGGTVQQLWSTEMDFYAPFLGTSYPTPSGNYIFTFGTIGVSFITTGDGYSFTNSSDTEEKTVIVELDNSGNETGRLTIPKSGTYRAERINF